ncbi:ATP-dependent nuclease [Microbacterium sp.]|uniref:ATP-dependent nuclease n=1 Tax=Microbacterium sp. TaxID=51671 RepID=UPI003F9A20EA
MSIDRMTCEVLERQRTEAQPTGGLVRIGRVTIKNYSRLADWDIEVRRHLVLIGANDVGKSSFLRLMNLTLGPAGQLYQQLSTTDIRDTAAPLEVSVTFLEFDDDDRALFHREISVNAEDKHESLEIRLEVSIDPEDEDTIVLRRWCPGRGEVRSLTREQIAKVGWRYLPALRQSQLDGPSGAVQALLRAAEPTLGTGTTTLSGVLETFNNELASNERLSALRTGVATHMSSAMPRAISADDLALRTGADPSASVLDNVSLYLSRDGSFMPLSEQSDGIRQLIAMTLFDLAEGAANVVAVDEPELHLHPLSQRTVAELLTSATNQKILVTHSPYIVQKFDPTEVVTVRADGSAKQIEPSRLTVEERAQAHWWSPRMLEALTARVAIVVEGVADRLVVEAAARLRGFSLDRHGAVIFELGGADNFPTVYKLIGPAGFDIDVLGLVDEAELPSWIGAVGGKPVNVVDQTVFASSKDLEDEYCRAIGPRVVAERLIAAGVARDDRTILSSCGVDTMDELDYAAVAKFCRSNAGKGKGNRKVPAALAIGKTMTAEEATKITSINKLLDELERRVSK